MLLLGTGRPVLSSVRMLTVRLGVVGAVAMASLTSCDAINPIPFVGSISLSPTAVLLDSIGDTVRFTATAQDRNGVTIPLPALSWRSGDDAVATVDQTGLATAVGNGATMITAFVGAVLGSATLEVFLDPVTGSFASGKSYFGRREYTEYQAGDLPLVIAAPHGGYLEPEEIPDRTSGVTTRDRNTQELARAVATVIAERSGGVPHLVINHLHRAKLDANREVLEAAQGNAFAARAWEEHHAFIDAASETITESYGHGLFVDLHGHGHDIQRLELGYLLQPEHLALSDELLNAQAVIDRSSIRSLWVLASRDFAYLIRGAFSLGSLLESNGFPAVPSTNQPDPGVDPYFTGGYSTVRHGSREGGTVSGIQIEAHWAGLRDAAESRSAFAEALANALDTYFQTHFGVDWSAAETRR